MQKIQVNSFYSTGLSQDFTSIRTIEIEDAIFAKGGFGVVYHCSSLNDNQISVPQVIKILKSNIPGNVDLRFKTIQKLQDNLRIANIDLLADGKPGIDQIPALKGIPQFSFEGVLKNEKVYGYAANDLNALGFISFNSILDDPNLDLKRQYLKLPIKAKFQLCFHLVYGFEILQKVNFVHADINPQNFFVNLIDYELAIIDFDSGAIIDSPSDHPDTYGKTGEIDWLAPEILEQIGGQIKAGQIIKVDLYSDIWSVNIALHFLIFLNHPFFFLKYYEPGAVRAYLSNNRWNRIENSDPNYSQDLEYARYKEYIKLVNKHIPEEIFEKWKVTYSEGFDKPEMRVTYAQWSMVFGDLKELSSLQKFLINLRPKKIIAKAKNALGKTIEIKDGWIIDRFLKKVLGRYPGIKSFQASHDFNDGSKPIVLTWETEHADKVLLNDREVSPVDSLIVSPTKETTYTLKLKSNYIIDIIEKAVTIRVDTTPPYIHYFKVEPVMARGGQPVKLSWLIEGAISIEIEGIGMIQGNSVEISPIKDTIYTLKAVSFAGIETIQRTGVEVDKTPPTIRKYTVSPKILKKPQPVKVVWETEGTELVQISGFGNFPSSGVTDFIIREDTPLVLTAVSHYNITESRQIDITTSKEPPVIHEFNAKRLVLTNANPTDLFWNIENADRIEIDQGVGDVTNQVSTAVHTMTDKVYTLTAWSYFGVSAQAKIEISVDKTPPEIISFNSDKQFVLSDHLVQLSWNVPNAYAIELLPLNIQAEKNGIYNAIVNKDTLFKLVATSYFGYSNGAELYIRVLPIPIIESLLVPSMIIEENLSISYQLLVPERFATNSIEFNNHLEVALLNITELKVESFMPPLEVKDKNLTEVVIETYKKYVDPAFERIKQIVNDKIEHFKQNN